MSPPAGVSSHSPSWLRSLGILWGGFLPPQRIQVTYGNTAAPIRIRGCVELKKTLLKLHHRPIFITCGGTVLWRYERLLPGTLPQHTRIYSLPLVEPLPRCRNVITDRLRVCFRHYDHHQGLSMLHRGCRSPLSFHPGQRGLVCTRQRPGRAPPLQ